MEQDKLTFEKGYMPQLDTMNQIPGSYIDALNIMRDDSGNIMNELGSKIVKELPNGYTIVGVKNLNSDIIVASTDNTNSEIGVLSELDTYTTIINSPVFGFTKTNKVNIEARVNYKGQRIIYIAGKGIKLRVLNLDLVPTSNLDKSTSLFLEYTLPKTDLMSVGSGGQVLSGVYQFGARLVTSNNNTTPFGIITGVIPIGSGSSTYNRKDYDGAPPQTVTPNMITLKVSNIDQIFEYIEPCVITYTGEANILSVKSLGKKPILGRTEITFAYSSGTDEQGSISEEELTIDVTNFESAEYITQKDNTLLLGNLTEKEETFDWQAVANSIELHWVEKEFNHTESIVMTRGDGNTFESLISGEGDTIANIDDDPNSVWTDMGTTSDFYDYKNPETCAKFMSYRRNEVYSFTFTPVFVGGRKGSAYHIPSMTTSEITNIHPGAVTTDLLGVVECASHTYPSEFGYFSGRKVRYHKMPSTVTSPFTKKVNGQEKIVALGIKAIINSTLDWKSGLIGYIIGRENRIGRETILAQGITRDIYPVLSGKYSPVPSFGLLRIRGVNSVDRSSPTSRHDTAFTFHSPDITLDEGINYVPNKITKVMNYIGEFKYGRFGAGGRCKHTNLVYCSAGTADNTSAILNGKMTMIDNQYSHETDAADGGNNMAITILDSISLVFRRMMGCLALQTTTALPRVRNKFADDIMDADDSSNITYYGFKTTTDVNVYPYNNFPVELYNLEVSRVDYYGDVFDKEAIPINTVLFSVGSYDIRTGEKLPNVNTSISFGGDTFISRYAYTFRDTSYLEGSFGKNQSLPVIASTVYFMVESINNYNYRHYITETTDTEGTTPYYPKYRILQNGLNGINDLPVKLGHPTLYNRQYSAQNTVQNTYSKSVDEEQVTGFTNRVAYSYTSIEGERFDAFRLFLSSNYHDISKQFGKITGLFVQGSDLYIHTERALWRSFYNTLAIQATSVGDTVLGNGGAFPRPSVPIMTVEGGYAGCKDISASIGTPNGRYFYDHINCKLFRLAEGLQEVSNPAIFDLLRSTLHNADVVLGYDYGRKRLLLSNPQLTLSYKPELSSFDGRHSYSFDHFISRGLNDYLIKDKVIHNYDTTVVGKVFNVTNNAKVTIASIVSLDLSKRYTSGYMILDSINPATKEYLPFEFFDTLQVYSKERNTGVNTFKVIKEYTEDLETLGNIFVYKANNKFRFNIPQDIVNDINRNIKDPSNLKTYNTFSSEDRIFLSDMIDNHVVFELVIDNTTQRIIKLKSFVVNFDQNIT